MAKSLDAQVLACAEYVAHALEHMSGKDCFFWARFALATWFVATLVEYILIWGVYPLGVILVAVVMYFSLEGLITANEKSCDGNQKPNRAKKHRAFAVLRMGFLLSVVMLTPLNALLMMANPVNVLILLPSMLWVYASAAMFFFASCNPAKVEGVAEETSA